MGDITGIESKGVVDSNLSFDFNTINQNFAPAPNSSSNQSMNNESMDFSTYTEESKTKSRANEKSSFEKIGEMFGNVGATIVEFCTSLLAGVGNIFESLYKSQLVRTSDVISLFNKDLADSVVKWTEKDYVASWVDDFHNNSDIGQYVSEHSYMSTDSAFSSSMKNLGHTLEETGATIGVVCNSIETGLENLFESIFDGILYGASSGRYVISKLLGQEELGKEYLNIARQTIARDFADEKKETFYNYTAIGRKMNELSHIKYDSDTANTIEDVSEKVGAVVMSVILTVVSGGTAAPFETSIVGGMYGLGESAETTYQTIMESEDYNGYIESNPLQELTIVGSGVLNAFSWQSTGNLGSSLLNIGTTAFQTGGVEAIKNLFKFAFSKENLLNVFSTKNTILNAVSSFLQSGSDIAEIFTKMSNGQEVTVEEIKILATEFAARFGLNYLDDILKGGVKLYDGVLENVQNITMHRGIKEIIKELYEKINVGEVSVKPSEYEEIIENLEMLTDWGTTTGDLVNEYYTDDVGAILSSMTGGLIALGIQTDANSLDSMFNNLISLNTNEKNQGLQLFSKLMKQLIIKQNVVPSSFDEILKHES